MAEPEKMNGAHGPAPDREAVRSPGVHDRTEHRENTGLMRGAVLGRGLNFYGRLLPNLPRSSARRPRGCGPAPPALVILAEEHEVPLRRIGTVGGDRFAVRANGTGAIRLAVEALGDAVGNGLAVRGE